jgi:hypothetical protein
MTAVLYQIVIELADTVHRYLKNNEPYEDVSGGSMSPCGSGHGARAVMDRTLSIHTSYGHGMLGVHLKIIRAIEALRVMDRDIQASKLFVVRSKRPGTIYFPLSVLLELELRTLDFMEGILLHVGVCIQCLMTATHEARLMAYVGNLYTRYSGHALDHFGEGVLPDVHIRDLFTALCEQI